MYVPMYLHVRIEINHVRGWCLPFLSRPVPHPQFLPVLQPLEKYKYPLPPRFSLLLSFFLSPHLFFFSPSTPTTPPPPAPESFLLSSEGYPEGTDASLLGSS
jgi:hypothetical protein